MHTMGDDLSTFLYLEVVHRDGVRLIHAAKFTPMILQIAKPHFTFGSEFAVEGLILTSRAA
jgi:hypothetical protein